jgi:hypothetical protein
MAIARIAINSLDQATLLVAPGQSQLIGRRAEDRRGPTGRRQRRRRRREAVQTGGKRQTWLTICYAQIRPKLILPFKQLFKIVEQDRSRH